MPEAAPPPPSRPGVVRRVAAGAWHVPAGFAIILRHPRLWPLAALPVILTVGLMFLGAVLGIFLIPWADGRVAPTPGSRPVWVELPTSLLLWTAMVGTGVFLGLGVALLLAALGYAAAVFGRLQWLPGEPSRCRNRSLPVPRCVAARTCASFWSWAQSCSGPLCAQSFLRRARTPIRWRPIPWSRVSRALPAR